MFRFGAVETQLPLIKAVRSGQIDEVKTLLTSGADVNATDQAGETALMHVFGYLPYYVEREDPRDSGVLQDKKKPLTEDEMALLNQRLAIAQLLLDHGADINFCERNQRSIFKKVFYRYHNQPLNGYLLEHEFNSISLSYHNLPFIIFLLRAGANMNYVDMAGYTPAMHLMKCIDSETLPILQVMVEHGLDVNVVNQKTNESLLSLAARISGQHAHEVVKFLLAKGADRNELYKNGKTDLMYAVQWDDEALFTKSLASSAVDVNAKDASGESALFKAVTLHRSHFYIRLLAANARLEHSIINIARDKDLIDLLDAGANLQTHGAIILMKLFVHCCTDNQHLNTILSLIKRMPKEQLNLNVDGRTPLEMATSYKASCNAFGRRGMLDFDSIIEAIQSALAIPDVEVVRQKSPMRR